MSRLVDSSLGPARLAQSEIDGAAVGRESDLLAAAERLRGRVADELAFDRNAGPAELPARDREAEQARTHARLGPRIPVADEQLVVGAARAGLRLCRAARRS